jgi:SnoaL-like domain
MDPIAHLMAVHEIEQLVYRYAWAFDTRDFNEYRALWAETDQPTELPVLDGHFCRSQAFLEAAAELGPTFLFVGNHLIDFDDEDHACGRVYCLCQQDIGGTFIDQSILYRDRYVRQDGRWLFASREHLLFFGQPRDRNPYDQEPANWPENAVGAGTLPGDFETYRLAKGFT